MDWKRLLGYVTGSVDQETLLSNEGVSDVRVDEEVVVKDSILFQGVRRGA